MSVAAETTERHDPVQSPRGGDDRWRVPTAVLFLAVGVVVALIRFRESPLYPHLNGANTDVYVYQMVGNSWRYGQVPYIDIYDVKGPMLYVTFLMLSYVRPWSMVPPLVVLILLATVSTWIAYRVARLRGFSTLAGVLIAVIAIPVVYLAPINNPSSFTGEEVAVPGVLLLTWLLARWFADRAAISTWWWVVDGFAAGVVFWIKYSDVMAWVAVLLGLLVFALARREPITGILRVVAFHLSGMALASLIALAPFGGHWLDAAQFYLLGKAQTLNASGELKREVKFALVLLHQDTGAALLLACLVLALAVRSMIRPGAETRVLLLGFAFTAWVSLAFVQHPYNLFVPLAFVPSAATLLLTPGLLSGRYGLLVKAAALIAAGLLVMPSVIYSREHYGLFWAPPRIVCYTQPSHQQRVFHESTANIFAMESSHSAIITPGLPIAAQAAFISKIPMTHKFQFVDHSWESITGAEQVQAHYLEEGTFPYAWVHVLWLKPRGDVLAQVQKSLDSTSGKREQAAALARNYVPVMTCNNDVLLRLKGKS